MILKKKQVLWVYIFAAVLWLQYVIHVTLLPMMNVLYFNIHTFRSMCTVPFVAVFCSCMMSCFTGMWLGSFMINVEMVPGTLVITGMGFVCIFRTSYFSIVSHFGNLSGHPCNHVAVS
jgi:hypothetical protein